jgi:hypothetical protein
MVIFLLGAFCPRTELGMMVGKPQAAAVAAPVLRNPRREDDVGDFMGKMEMTELFPNGSLTTHQAKNAPNAGANMGQSRKSAEKEASGERL